MLAEPIPTRALRAAFLIVLALVAMATPTRASTVVAKTFTDLCAEADMIFSASVTEVRSRRVAADRGDLETLVTFAAIEPITGVADMADPSITLRFAGGVLDGVREEFLGVPRFAVGERVVLFARKGYAISPIVGLSQGCFRVVESATGATLTTAEGRPVTTVDLPVPAGDGGQATGDSPVPLSRFIHAVRNELDAQGRR